MKELKKINISIEIEKENYEKVKPLMEELERIITESMPNSDLFSRILFQKTASIETDK